MTREMTGAMTRLGRLVGRPETALLVLALGSFAYFYQAGGWNQNSRFALVRALVEDGTARLDRHHHGTRDLSCMAPDGACLNPLEPDPSRGEHFYCDKAPGAQLLAVPAYATIHLVAGSDRPSPTALRVAAYLTTVWTVALPSALGVVALYLLLGALGIPAGRRAAAAAAYGLGTWIFPYATLYYGHALAASLLVIGFALLVRARRLEPDRPPPVATLLGAGLLLGTAVSVEYPAALAAAAVGGYALWSVRPWPRIGWLVLGGAIPGAATAAYHWIVFGGPLVLPYDFSIQGNRSAGFFMGIGVPETEPLWHILVSGYRGLFYASPWLLLFAPGAYLLWRRGFRAELAVCALVTLLFVALNGSLVDWNGGWAMGARYLIPALPFLAVLAAGVLLGEARPWRAVWLAGAAGAAYATYLMLVGTAVKPEVPDAYVEPPRQVVKIDRPYQQFLLPHFRGGELAVNTQGIGQVGARRRGIEFVGERRAFNLGQLVGLPGRASLIPLLLFWAGCGLWLVWAVRRLARSALSSGGDGAD